MVSVRIFVCAYKNKRGQQNAPYQNLVDPGKAHLLPQVCRRLQEAGAEVITYAGDVSDAGFLPFVKQELPNCQWFLLFQTPAAVQSQQICMAMNMALGLVKQGKIWGILRFVATSSGDETLPARWSTLTTFEATQDPLLAQEKLLLALSGDLPTFEAGAATQPEFVGPLDQTTFPATAGSHASAEKAVSTKVHQSMVRRKRTRRMLLLGISVLLVILAAGLVLVNFFVLPQVTHADPDSGHASAASTASSVPITPTDVVPSGNLGLPAGTPTPHPCSQWAVSSNPVYHGNGYAYSNGGTYRTVSAYCGGLAYFAFTSAPAVANTQVRLCLRNGSCGSWVRYTAVGSKLLVAQGLVGGATFHLQFQGYGATGSYTVHGKMYF
ncbi:MAG TPA: hypothetical protein VGN34_04535 [Ktedonobacteraceae bacterium]|jgi:hypothetical protein